MRILFAGGGTGGHLFPGLALADEIRRLRGDMAIEFIGTDDGLEKDIVPAAGYPLYRIASRRGPPLSLQRPLNFLFFLHALGQCRRLLGMPAPAAAVVSLGGFAAAAPGLAAILARIPLAALEQNAVPGRATRFLARWARELYLQFDEARPYFERSAAALFACGSPLRQEIARLASEDAPTRCHLLVMGGSQGARSLNRVFAESLPLLLQSGCHSIAHLAGACHEDEARAAAAAHGEAVKVYGFCRDMASLYRGARLAVARAGALSLAELAAAGVPAILVPFPAAADDHQLVNARIFEAAGAALVIEEKGLTAAALAAAIATLWHDEERLAKMRQAMRGLARPEAGAFMARRILALCGIAI